MNDYNVEQKGFNSKFKSIIDATPLCLNLWNINMENILCNRQAAMLFDLDSEQQYIENFFKLSPEYQPNGRKSDELAKEHVIKAFETGYNRFKWLHCKLNGEEVPCEITLTKINYTEEDLVAGFTRDLRDELMGSNSVDEYENYFLNNISEKVLFKKVAEISKEWYFSFDIRTSLIRFYGNYDNKPSSEYLPLNAPLKKGKIHEEDADLFLKLMENMRKGYYEPLDIRYLQPNGSYRYIRFMYEMVNDPNDNPVFVVGKGIDVHDQKTLERRSRIDLLTECYNKKTAEYMIVEMILEKKEKEFALFFIDIDDFKNINYNVSHEFGDEILKLVAKSIKSIFRSDDIVARIGGDEFIVFTANPGKKNVLDKKARDILKLLSISYPYNDKEYSLSASVGVATHENAQSFDDLYKAADRALYKAKSKGKNTHVFYDNTLEKSPIIALTKLENSKRIDGTIIDFELVTEVFDILYNEKNDISTCVNNSLQYIGAKFDADRSYIFETFDNGKTYDNTYEYCKKDINPEIANLQGITSDVLSEFFIDNHNGILFSNDLAATFKQENAYKLMADQGIKSFAHAQIKKDGYVTFFLGLDDCTKARIWSDRETNSLQYIAKIMSIMLKSVYLQEEVSNLGEYNRTTMHISEISEEVSYVSDIDTYELLHVNRALLNILGNPPESKWKGGKCYEILQGKTSPCDFCTNHLLNEHSSYEWTFYNPVFEKTFLLKDKLIPIKGKLARLETAIDITKVSELELTLKEKLEDERFITSCIAELHSEDLPKTSITKILGHIAKYFSSFRTVLFQISKCGKYINNTYDYCEVGFSSRIDMLQNVPIENANKLFKIIKEKKQYYSESLEKSFNKSDADYIWLKDLEVDNFIVSSIKDVEGNTTGFIAIENPQTAVDKMWILESISKFLENFINKNELISSLNQLSYYNSLTGIYNRQSYIDAISKENLYSLSSLGVAHININKMRSINITKGFAFGDAIIKKTADILSDVFDTNVYHIGGDEFVVVLKDEDEIEFDEKIKHVKEVFSKEKEFSVSIGFAWNKNTPLLHENEEGTITNEIDFPKQGFTSILNENLRREILEGKYIVYLQPQVDMKTGLVVSAEALIRRKDAKGNVQPPITFIPFYEKEGAISQIDLFVFETISKLFQSWDQSGISKETMISVNFSRHTIAEKEIVEQLCSICEKYCVKPERFVIEITETINSVDDVSLSEIIDSFVKAGFKISLDDFGSGHSNLSSLRFSNFDEIKLDMGIIRELHQKERLKILAENALVLCKSLDGVDSVAEGIETVEQYILLKEMGCDKGQGYYFDKPIPIDIFEKKYVTLSEKAK